MPPPPPPAGRVTNQPPAGRGLRGRSIAVAELRGGIHILGHGFQVQSHWLGNSEGGIFSGLEGARLCLRNSMAAFVSWGAGFIWLGAQRAACFRFRGRPVVVAVLRGGIRILGRRFQVQSPWLGSSEGGIFHV